METMEYQRQADECIKKQYPVSGQAWSKEYRELFALGYASAMKVILARLQQSRVRMVNAYSKNLKVVPDNEAYHGATAVMALEVNTIIDELKEARL